MRGREVVSYYYWILFNFGIKNIRLVNSLDQIDDSNTNYVFFHADEYKILKNLKNIKRCQWVTDREMIHNCDKYFVVDHSLDIIDNHTVHFLNHPLPARVEQCTPVFPPKVFSSICNRYNLNKKIRENKSLLEEKYNIEVRIQHHDWFNKGDEDVLFMLRDREYLGSKPASRLFHSQVMRVPAILSSHSSYSNLGEYILANTYEEFEKAVSRLCTDKDYFIKYSPTLAMTPHILEDRIVNQFTNAF